MRILFLILLILFSSCKVTKYKSIHDFDFDKDKIKPDTIVKKDSIKLGDIELDGVPDVVDKDPDTPLSPNPKFVKNKNVNNVGRNPSSIAEVELIDSTDSLNTSEGIIAYTIPTKMVVGQKYNIKIRITKDRGGKNVLVVGERNIPINDVGVDSKIMIEDIEVDKTMTSEIMCDTTVFSIQPLSSKVQNIDDKGYTEWAWILTPLKSGKAYLKIIVKARVDDKDIVVFDKKIEVEPDRIYSVKNWFSKYWQWLMTTIIIPFIVWFYKRRKKEEEED